VLRIGWQIGVGYDDWGDTGVGGSAYAFTGPVAVLRASRGFGLELEGAFAARSGEDTSRLALHAVYAMTRRTVSFGFERTKLAEDTMMVLQLGIGFGR
jgi:hypothetical protein